MGHRVADSVNKGDVGEDDADTAVSEATVADAKAPEVTSSEMPDATADPAPTATASAISAEETTADGPTSVEKPQRPADHSLFRGQQLVAQLWSMSRGAVVHGDRRYLCPCPFAYVLILDKEIARVAEDHVRRSQNLDDLVYSLAMLDLDVVAGESQPTFVTRRF